VNSSVISGTPRKPSMKATQKVLTISKSDCRPNASRMPIGNENAMPEIPITVDSRNPPN